MSEVCKENSTAKSRISAFEKTIKESKPVDEQKQRQRARFEVRERMKSRDLCYGFRGSLVIFVF